MKTLPARWSHRLTTLLFGALVGFGDPAEGDGFCCCLDGTFLFCFGTKAVSCFEDGEGLGLPSVQATILDLSSKGLPIEMEEDADPKDTNTTRAKYTKGQDDAAFLPSKRFLLRGKRDAAAARLTYDREVGGDFSAGIYLAVEPDGEPQGLVSGESAAFFEIVGVGGPEGEPSLLDVRLTATWDGDDEGFIVTAEDAFGPVGVPTLLPGTRQVYLEVVWNQDFRALSAQPYEEGDFEEGGGFYHEDAVPRPAGLFVTGFGVEGLGKKGRVYFTNLGLQGPLVSGAGEAGPAVHAALALASIEQAFLLAGGGGHPFEDLEQAVFLLEDAMMHLETAEELLDEAVEEGELHPTTQRKLARKSLKKARKRGKKSVKLGNKIVDKGKGKTKALRKRIDRVRWQALLVQAQLFGFKSKSIGKYFKTLVVQPSLF